MRATKISICALLAISIQGCGSPDAPNVSAETGSSIINDSSEKTMTIAQSELIQVEAQNPKAIQDIQKALTTLQADLAQLQAIDLGLLNQDLANRVKSLSSQFTSEINLLEASLSAVVGGGGGGGGGGAGGGSSCSFNGQTIANGASVTSYKASSVPFGQSCESQSRLCTNGQLTGNYTFSACTVNPGKTCTMQASYAFYGAAPFLNPMIWTNVASSADCAVLCGSVNQPGACQYVGGAGLGISDHSCVFSSQPNGESLEYFPGFDMSAGYCQ